MANLQEGQVFMNFRIDEKEKIEFKKILKKHGLKTEFVLNTIIKNFINDYKNEGILEIKTINQIKEI